MKIGLFFGSFNPIHQGHLIIANIMVETTDLEKIWFVVSPQNPFKKRESLLHEFDRLDMVDAAIHDNYNFKSSDIEFNMPKPSYTVDTLTYLTDKYEDHEFKLIMGEDNLKHFPKWKNHEQILDLYGIYVYPRPEAASTPLHKDSRVFLVDAPLINISATFIRKCVKKDQSIQYMVPDSVINIISTRKFYL